MVESLAESRTADLASLSASCWDVVVIGAGPAGGIAALETARRGRSVLLVDKSRFPRYKVCGGCLNGRALGVLQRVGQLEIVKRRGKAIHTFVLAVGNRVARLPLPAGVSMSRQAFDSTLTDAAIREGAEFLDGCKAALGKQHRDGWVVTLSRGRDCVEVFARMVLAADGLGHSLREARQQDSTIHRTSPLGAGVMLQDGAGAYQQGEILMAVARGGYVGMVNVEDGRVNVAAAFRPEFVRRCGGLGRGAVSILQEAGVRVPEGLGDAKWRGTRHLTRRPHNQAAHRLLVLGDAAGYVEPFTGEGIAWALESGREAAALACRSIESFDSRVERIWTRRHEEIVGHSQRRCALIAAGLRRVSLMRLAVTLLARAPRFATPIIRRLNARSQGEASQ